MDWAIKPNEQTAEEWQAASDALAAAEAMVETTFAQLRRTKSASAASDLCQALKSKERAKDRMRELMHTIWDGDADQTSAHIRKRL